VLSALALFLCLLSGQSAFASGELRADGKVFRDSQGRSVFLRGVNVSGDSKSAPFLPLQSRSRIGEVDPSLLDPLPGWGFNTIRLLFNWEAYEPEPGRYNEAYLDQLTALADGAWARGIYVIVDMHQDAYSRYLSGGCGEGFPAWAVPARYRHLFTTPPRDCGLKWTTLTTLSSDMHHSFRDFYADSEGARTAFLALWGRLARRFASHPGVIGYDILNEPWGSEKGELAPLYRDAARVIRAEDPHAILFVEPLVFMTTFGFRKSELPKPDFDNFAYAPHFYDPLVAALNSWSFWRSGIARHAFDRMTAKARELDAPLFVGEFGESGTMGNARWFTDYQYDELDTLFVSGAQWNYTPSWSTSRHDGWNSEDMSIVDAEGALRSNYRSRPYARAIAGEPVSQQEVRARGGDLASYELEWRQSGDQGETEIYLPAEMLREPEIFETGFEGPGLSCETDLALSRIRCRSRSAGSMSFRVSRRTPASKAGS
jgi:endoglycosylceramidase